VSWDWLPHPLAFMELFIVLAFGVGWLILEYVSRRYDKHKQPGKTDDDSRSS